MNKIKLIMFDFNGVTVKGSYPETMKYFAKRYGGNWKKLYAVFYTHYFNLAATNEISLQESWTRPLKEFHIPLTWQQAIELHLKLQYLNMSVAQYVLSLRKKGYLCIVVSKNHTIYWKKYKQRMRFHTYFDEVINLQEFNLPKAHSKTIRFLCRRYHMKPNEIIYIDDQQQNLAPAKKLGVHTILYKNFKQMRKEITHIISV